VIGLAIECSGSRIAIGAFGDGGALLAERARDSQHEHARWLLTLIDETMAAAALRPADLDGIAIDVGPGSFTALRVGLATARGLAHPHSIPVVGVTSFAALVEGRSIPRALVVPLVPAGRGLCYAGFHRGDPRGDLSLLRGPAVGSVDVLRGAVQEALTLCPRGTRVVFLGPGAARDRAALEALWPGSVDPADPSLAGPSAAAVARVGARFLGAEATAATPPGFQPARPLYVRAPQAVERAPLVPASGGALEILPFQEADLDEVLAVENRVFPDPWPRQFFLDEIRVPQSLACVARERGILAGYLLAWRLDGEMHLGNIAVAPAFQRRGIGRFLVDWLIRQAREGGQRRITLEVRASNFPAQELYRRFGFRAVALRRGYYQDTGEDALVMLCDVDEPRVPPNPT
jgi:ribosomal-protein-alanine N-acetyltransferase